MDPRNSTDRRAPVTVTGIVFRERNKPGDFKWMVKQPAYDNCAFLFTENYIDMVREDSVAGGGTACLRPYSMYHQIDGKPLRAMGIPTGWSSDALGFRDLDRDTKRLVDLSFERIAVILQTTLQSVTTLYFSCDSQDTTKLGTGIFAKTLHSDVVDYISLKLKMLPIEVKAPQTAKLPNIRVEELKMLRTALLVHAAAEESLKRKRGSLNGPLSKQTVDPPRKQQQLKLTV